MRRMICWALVSAAAGLPLSAAPVKEPPAVKGWGKITDPDGDCRVVEDKGGVTITIPKTHHDLTYTDEYSKLNSPRVLRPVEKDFTLRVKVREFPLPNGQVSSGGKHVFVGAGLLIWQDKKNFIRLDRAAVAKPDGSSFVFVWVERFKDGKSESHALKPLADKPTGLAVERKGNRFRFLYDAKGDGQDWTEAHAEEIELPAELQVGVNAVNTTAREFTARLTDLELERQK